MSHIVAFRIEGLAGREKPVELKLNRDTNIFFGLNGSGKTSLLKILHAAMKNDTSILHRVPFAAAEVEIYSKNWDKVFTRSIKKPKSPELSHRKVVKSRIIQGNISYEMLERNDVLPVETLEQEIKWTCTPNKPKDASSTNWRHEYLPTTRLHVSDEPFLSHEYSPSNPRWLTEEQLDLFFARSVEHLWSRYSAEILGAVRMAQEQGLASILRVVLSTKDAKHQNREVKLTASTAYERVKNFLTRQGSASILGTPAAFEKRYKEDVILQDVVQDIDSVEAKIEQAMASRNTLQKLISNMFRGNKEIQFTDKSIEVQIPSGDKIGLASLSSGEKHLLRILVQTLLVEESSIMIDEPEISLHIDWQKDLIQSMRALNPNAQLILATHSPEIMGAISDDKIFKI